MTVKVVVVSGIVNLVILMGMPSVTVAQNAGEIAGGYQFMRQFPLGGNFPAGWFVSAGAELSDTLALVGEVAGSQMSETSTHVDVTSDRDVLTVLGGARFGMEAGPIRPFGQMLVGLAMSEMDVSGTGFEPHSASDQAFAIQPGGGVDIPLTESVAARAMVDYRRIYFGDDTGVGGVNQMRVAVGLVIGFGGN